MARLYCLSRKAAVSERRRGALAFRPMGTGPSRARRRSLLAICASDGGSPGAAAGLPPDAIASHAEPAEVKADPREEGEVGQCGQP